MNVFQIILFNFENKYFINFGFKTAKLLRNWTLFQVYHWPVLSCDWNVFMTLRNEYLLWLP